MAKEGKKFALGAAIAAAGGYVAGILTAPKSGKETRKDIKDTANRSMAEAEKQLKALHTQLSDVIEQAKTEADQLKGHARREYDSLMQKTQEAKDRTRELLSNLHEDVAEDKELQQAIKDADKAIEHLRSFLNKKLS
ncbi:MAG TPA: YtxH domain-containing protein [Candidatus Saccharimonadales bacterium]|nr:YtxH domain-containing protein [Candidatus Saccharimonadales bacterium]